MTSIVTVRHNFETAHRLPFLLGKCESIHGHSWWVEWDFAGEADEDGILLEYGDLKRGLRYWVDTYLDHGTMLGKEDPLLMLPGLNMKVLLGKVFVFGASESVDWPGDLKWPTVENVAKLLYRVAAAVTEVQPLEVRVQETHVNGASYRP